MFTCFIAFNSKIRIAIDIYIFLAHYSSSLPLKLYHLNFIVFLKKQHIFCQEISDYFIFLVNYIWEVQHMKFIDISEVHPCWLPNFRTLLSFALKNRLKLTCISDPSLYLSKLKTFMYHIVSCNIDCEVKSAQNWL